MKVTLSQIEYVNGKRVDVWTGDLADFFKVNADAVDMVDQSEIVAALRTAGEYKGGGGASGLWWLTQADDDGLASARRAANLNPDETTFGILPIGWTFDWISPKPFNSFYHRCRKIAPRRYLDLETGDEIKIGSVSAFVFHIEAPKA